MQFLFKDLFKRVDIVCFVVKEGQISQKTSLISLIIMDFSCNGAKFSFKSSEMFFFSIKSLCF